MKKRMQRLFGLVFSVIGTIFLVDSETNITGAFSGFKSLSLNFFIGAILLIAGIIIFSTAPATSLETRVGLSSSIKKNPGLLRLTQETVRDEIVEREMNHLIKELSKGNFEAGLGKPGHVEGTDVFYLRGRNGARLYYRRTGKNNYDVVGKSAKGNQDKVMSQLKKTY